jgi:hypothetical protein
MAQNMLLVLLCLSALVHSEAASLGALNPPMGNTTLLQGFGNTTHVVALQVRQPKHYGLGCHKLPSRPYVLARCLHEEKKENILPSFLIWVLVAWSDFAITGYIAFCLSPQHFKGQQR